MADQHNDNIPAIANTILNDVADIKENLEYHKDVFETITTGWSNTSTTGILPKRTVTTFSSETSKTISSLTETGIYKVSGILDNAANNSIYLRFNADSGTNYLYLLRYEYDGASSGNNQTSATGQTEIALTLNVSGIQEFDLIFAASPGDTTRIIVNFDSSYRRISTSIYGFYHGIGFYDGGSAMTSFTIASTSNLTGTMFTERIA